MDSNESIPLKQHLQNYGMKHCPIDNSLKLIGKKFTLHILRNMILLKQNKFSQFLRSVEGINTKTLSVRLQEMEIEGLIERKILEGRPIQVEYTLTKKGMALEPLLSFLASFSMKFGPQVIFADKKPRTIKQVFGTEILSKVYD